MKTTVYEDLRHRPDVIQLRLRIGIAYGITMGLAFAVATWGIDGFLLSQAHALYPWLKFIIGAMICMPLGGLAGWLVARFEKGLLALLIYLAVGLIFAWLIVALPFRILPAVLQVLDPEVGNLLNYTFYEGFNAMHGVATFWVSLFVGLAGILQLPLTEPAVFSTALFGKVAPLLVCILVMVINGVIVDTLNNEPLRKAVLHMEDTIEFAVAHEGQEVDQATTRAMRMASLRAVASSIHEPRRLIVREYDEYLGEIHVLVRFGSSWVDCLVIYNQPSFCDYLGSR
jgi:hypothetical protein